MLLCRVWLGRWTSRSSVGTSGLAPLVEDSVCCRRLPPSMGYHSCDCIEEGFNIQQTGIEGDRMSASDVSSVPIVTNQSPPSSKIRACPRILNPPPLPAVARARRASATSTSAAPTSKRSRRAAKKESKNRVPQSQQESGREDETAAGPQPKKARRGGRASRPPYNHREANRRMDRTGGGTPPEPGQRDRAEGL